MKKFAIKAVAIAAGALAAGGVLAGTVSVTGGTTNFAVEALTSSTVVTTPNYVYTMGVGRPIGNGFTIINTPSAGSTFGTCVVPTYAQPVVTAGPPSVSITLKRQSSTECAYDVQVALGATVVGDTFTWTGQTYVTHSLATAGSTVSVSVNLKDPGETSQVDNAGPVTAAIATSGRALTLTAAADTATVANVNHLSGPLFGFLANLTVPADTASVAAANYVIGNNSGTTTFKMPNGTTNWDFTLHGIGIAVTVAGNFQGMATSGFAASTGVGVAPTVTATAAGSSATYTLLPSNITAGQTNTTATNSFTSAQTASLGTSRVFGVSASANVVTGAAAALAGNASWWTWSANASQLMTPFFNTNVNYITRFFFLNTGAAAVSFSTQCFTEGGNAVTNGAGGTLAANATTNVAASAACTFLPGTPRGAVIFTINAPIQAVKGTFQQISPTGANGVVQPLVRPYTAGATTE